jgi:hypothetical protein
MTSGRARGQYLSEGKIMRNGVRIAVVATVAGCSGQTIDAGTNVTAVGPNAGSPGGEPVIIASLIQQPPTRMASDGTTLFWSDGSNVSRVAVGGGAIRTLTPGYLLSVDDAGVYVYESDGGGGVYRVPKSGGAQVRISEASTSALIGRETTYGGNAYWAEWSSVTTTVQTTPPVVVKEAPLAGGPITTIGEFETLSPNGLGPMAVTSDAVFFGVTTPSLGVASFSKTTGVPDGGTLQNVPGLSDVCDSLVSDDDAVYCDPELGAITRIASDGALTTLGMAIGGQGGPMGTGLALDDTDVYWVDQAMVGTVMKVSKKGGTATTLARDANPIAIAVDATSVYWSDAGGTIERLSK